MKILLIGATGMIGSRILEQLTERQHQVTATSRSAAQGTQILQANDQQAVADLAQGHDAIIMAVSPPRDGSDPEQPLLNAGLSIIQAARQENVQRLVIVGGAGSLLLPDNSRLVDSPDFPVIYKAEALAHATFLDSIKQQASDLQWSYISPAALIEPGKLGGPVVLGQDHLVCDKQGNSYISAEDFAKVLIDELEQGHNIGQRMTAAYQ